MVLPLYLAMTAAEIRKNTHLPPQPAYMACHFSPYGTGLSNRPQTLPHGSMLILNDRTPIRGHDHGLIAAQLGETIENLDCECILLDFQYPDYKETSKLSELLVNTLPCPVGVSECCAEGLPCPVFLPPVPLDVPLQMYLAPWQGREIWLEAALGGEIITLTPDGSSTAPLLCEPPTACRKEEHLHCHYHVQLDENAAKFSLWRTREDLMESLEESQALGVTRAIGLWQELN